MLLPPLFKCFNDDIFIGGGIKISKPVTLRTGRASSELRVNNEVVVTYENDVRDRYGVEITDITLVQHDDTQVNVSIVGYDNFVNATNLTLKCTLIVIRQDGNYNLTQRPTIALLESLGKEIPVNLLGSTVIHPERSTGVRNDANDNRSVENRSRMFHATGFRQSIESHLNDHDKYVDVATKQTFPIYGPYKYDVIVVLNDDDITYTSIKRSLFVHGIYAVFVEPVRAGGVRTGVNLNDGVRLTWKISNESYTVTHVELRDNDGNTLVTVPPDGVVTVSSLGSYRGTMRGYVQYKNVHWSPLNYSNAIVFETSNEPTTIEFRVSNDEKHNIGFDQLYIQLVTLDMGTNTSGGSVLERTVTLRLYEDAARTIQRGNTLVFKRLYEAYIVSSLQVATAYYASYETNDLLNPVYSDILDAQYSTRTDPSLVTENSVGPEIEVTVIGTDPLMFSARITDSSYIVNARYSLNTDLEMDRVTTYQQWTVVNINELSNEVVLSQQELFVFFKDNTNVKPFLVSSDHGYAAFKLIIESTDIQNNRTITTVIIDL